MVCSWRGYSRGSVCWLPLGSPWWPLFRRSDRDGRIPLGSLNSGDELFFGVAYTVAYGLLASATWEWFRWLKNNLASGTGLTRVFRLLACANLVFAIGLVSVTYYWVHEAISTPYDGKLSIAIPTTNGLQLFGFCLVSAGFWWAASVLGAARPDLTPAESNAGEIADIDVPI